jgi:histidine triad (HIT) family protein
MSDCIFCRIGKGVSPANFVYKGDEFVAFHDIHPSAPVHILIVPVKHIESLNDIDELDSLLISRMMLKAREIAKLLGIAGSGYKVIINVGSGGGQVIFHLHIHLIGGWGR